MVPVSNNEVGRLLQNGHGAKALCQVVPTSMPVILYDEAPIRSLIVLFWSLVSLENLLLWEFAARAEGNGRLTDCFFPMQPVLSDDEAPV